MPDEFDAMFDEALAEAYEKATDDERAHWQAHVDAIGLMSAVRRRPKPADAPDSDAQKE